MPLPGVRPQCSAGLGCWMSSRKYETGVQKTTLLITTEEEIVVITAMGVMMIANNYFNDILDVTLDKLV